jgi:hypothetical protein
VETTRLGHGLVVALLSAQTLASLAFGGSPTLIGVALVFNLAAGVSTFLLVRRPGHSPWPVVAWCAGFFGWHVTGLGSLAGWWSTELDAVFLIASQREVSIAYQALLTTMAGFAVHLLVPRR